MFLVDTSVLIDYFKGRETRQTEILLRAEAERETYGIPVYAYSEVLFGAKTDKEFAVLKDAMLRREIVFFPDGLEAFENCAELYRRLRGKGVTVRGMTDVMIAYTAIYHGLYLLQSDRDFKAISANSELRLLEDYGK